jgi:crotonobetaine/carnitine-CoA ligase
VTSRAYDAAWVVSRLVADRAERFGDEVAVTTVDGATSSYGELAEVAARVGAALVALGVVPGDRVATMLDPTPTYLAAWFGSAWCGAIELPVNTDFKGDFLEHVLRESGASVLIVDHRWVDRLAGLDLPDLRGVLVAGGSPDGDRRGDAPLTPFEEAVAAAAPLPLVDRREHDPVYVMYTSGTSGPSKGAVHSNRSALWNAYAWLDVLSLTGDDVAYSMFPLFHVTARSAVVTSTLWAGGRVALRHGFSPTRFWTDVGDSGATFFAYMGSVIHLLWSAPPAPTDRAHRLRIAFGAAAPPELIGRFQQRFGVRLIEVYGSTELGLASAPAPDEAADGTMGRPCGHLELEIHDPLGERVAVGEDGEIVARPRSPHAMFQGYWANAAATVEAFRDLWFHTGDRGHLDGAGRLVFVDRIKDAIRRRGENISSFEVERAVQRHPAVLEAAAYAVPSEIAEDEVAVAVVLDPAADVDAAALFRYCVDALPRFAVPRYLRFVAALPKTPSQRIQKFKLRADGITPDSVDREALGIVVPRS